MLTLALEYLCSDFCVLHFVNFERFWMQTCCKYLIKATSGQSDLLKISLKSVADRKTKCWHITSLQEVMRLPTHPSSPEWPECGVKMLSGHFQALTDSLMGWWQASSSWTGSKLGLSYKSKRNSFPCYPPASAQTQLWICERQKTGSHFYCSIIWLIFTVIRVKWWYL